MFQEFIHCARARLVEEALHSADVDVGFQLMFDSLARARSVSVFALTSHFKILRYSQHIHARFERSLATTRVLEFNANIVRNCLDLTENLALSRNLTPCNKMSARNVITQN